MTKEPSELNKYKLLGMDFAWTSNADKTKLETTHISDSYKISIKFDKPFEFTSPSETKICDNDYVFEQIKLESENLKLDPLQEEVDKMPNIIEAIKKIINERLAPIVNLNFVYVNDINKADVRISFDETDGCWSYIGTDCKNPEYIGQPTINFSWFDVATTIHEFCHALGMIHEHQNPRNNLINWNLKAVYEWAKATQDWDKETTDFNIIEPAKIDETNGTDYDPESIMLYFYPPELTNDNKGTHENLRLSPQNVIYLNKIYPNSKQTPKEFYKNVYNENIDDENKNNNIPFYVYILFIIIILLIILIFIL
jgi:hypothetical protein